MAPRASEGVDYPQDIMKGAFIVGVPFEEPSSRLEALMRCYRGEVYSETRIRLRRRRT